MLKLDGKVAIITGGGGSLGAATARLFIQNGARVMLVDREADALNVVAGELPADQVATCVADVSDEVDTAAYVAATLDRFDAIDVLFSNAGNFGTVAQIADYPIDVFDSVLAGHVRGAFLAAKHAAPHMTKDCSIIITSSVAGVRGDAGVYAYITAKHAQVGLMRCLAKELGPRGIRVNTVHPGPVDNGFQLAVEDGLGKAMGVDGTELFNQMIPLGRHGSAEEIARSVLYLAGDDSSFVTGSTLMVDGGMSV
ncbi:Levodione reductase (plasmid) [Sulfitobacter sp. DSM 110093]|uniref:SDR family NAD(P)-dependent oxidoreductase n=1 Tax=Sulfitobacter sp. DSM 110093 TaxID=2883127 RepID=UPI001FAE3679|nr:SDR family NAD(P)-dependent oxidoreductase [Sulfitobacter sp. DSM 110093]UOA34288.1 Levodione reductase [Sulfitobacter sp. DSM 110093]